MGHNCIRLHCKRFRPALRTDSRQLHPSQASYSPRSVLITALSSGSPLPQEVCYLHAGSDQHATTTLFMTIKCPPGSNQSSPSVRRSQSPRYTQGTSMCTRLTRAQRTWHKGSWMPSLIQWDCAPVIFSNSIQRRCKQRLDAKNGDETLLQET